MSQLTVTTQASVSTPSTGDSVIYVDSSDKLLKSKNDAGVVTNYGAPGTSITSLTGEVTATGPGAAAATVTNSAVVAKILTGLTFGPGTILATDSILQAFGKLSNKGNSSVFPTATDGTVTIAADTPLSRDMYYDVLTINSGATLFPNGFRVFAATSIVNNGSIDRSGNNASGTAATPALAVGTLAAGTVGGAGGTAAGSAGGAASPTLGGAGGAGGLGSGGAGGAAGAQTVNSAILGGVEILQGYSYAKETKNIAGTSIVGGTGAGGGGGDGVAGGAGGGGGGALVVVTRSLTGTGSIKAMGGNGFTPVTGGNKGGGGGGGGGIICIASENDILATSLTLSVSGGSGASGTGTGVSGVNGSAGRIYLVRV